MGSWSMLLAVCFLFSTIFFHDIDMKLEMLEYFDVPLDSFDQEPPQKRNIGSVSRFWRRNNQLRTVRSEVAAYSQQRSDEEDGDVVFLRVYRAGSGQDLRTGALIRGMG